MRHHDLLGLPLADPAFILGEWSRLARQFFGGALTPLAIHWSARLTASLGVFVCGGTSLGNATGGSQKPRSQCIRLSSQLFQLLASDRDLAMREFRSTLAHEMIHQWQFESLNSRPNHGPTFRMMMDMMNQEGLGVSVYHSCSDAVGVLARYRWACTRCGQEYRRQRRTIDPRRHRCGNCRGSLKLLTVKGGGAGSDSILAGSLMRPSLPLSFAPSSGQSQRTPEEVERSVWPIDS